MISVSLKVPTEPQVQRRIPFVGYRRADPSLIILFFERDIKDSALARGIVLSPGNSDWQVGKIARGLSLDEYSPSDVEVTISNNPEV